MTRLACLLLPCVVLLAAASVGRGDSPDALVPLSDIGELVKLDPNAVVLSSRDYRALLRRARANGSGDVPGVVGTIDAQIAARVDGMRLHVAGRWTVRSTARGPIALPLDLAGVSILSATLDDRPAPLAIGKAGTLLLVVPDRGEHALDLRAVGTLWELAGGGVAWSGRLASPVSGKLTITAPGDRDVLTACGVISRRHDSQENTTTAILPVGGLRQISLVLRGNGQGRRNRPIVMGRSAMGVSISPAGQLLTCRHTVSVFRGDLRELTFSVPEGWTVTDVRCEEMVRWTTRQDGNDQAMLVRLARPTRGVLTIALDATGPAPTRRWTAPRVELRGADHQRGSLHVLPGRRLLVASESLRDARRADLNAEGLSIVSDASRRAYFHWGDRWSVALGLSPVGQRREAYISQDVVVGPSRIALDATLRFSPRGRDMHEATVYLPPRQAGWALDSVSVGQGAPQRDYRIGHEAGRTVLSLDLPEPILRGTDGTVRVRLQAVPPRWVDAAAGSGSLPDLAIPLIGCDAERVRGRVGLSDQDDLEIANVSAPAGLELVRSGRMQQTGLSSNVRAAYTWTGPSPAEPLRLLVVRLRPRLAARSVGLVSVSPETVSGAFAIDYHITRAAADRLHLLTDASLGRRVSVDCPGRRIASRAVVAPGGDAPQLPEALADRYLLWRVTLDEAAKGRVRLTVRYDVSRQTQIDVPLVRPVGVESAGEYLAVSASETLAVTAEPRGAVRVDPLELPAPPEPPERLLASFRLRGDVSSDAGSAGLTLRSTSHVPVAIPPAAVTSMTLETLLAADGGQQTQATCKVRNATLVSMRFSLPGDAELLSASVADQPSKIGVEPRGVYSVAIPRRREPTRVVLLYRCPPAGHPGEMRLIAPDLTDLPTNQVTWWVHTPEGMEIVDHRSALEADPRPRPWPMVLGGRSTVDLDTVASRVVAGGEMAACVDQEAADGDADAVAPHTPNAPAPTRPQRALSFERAKGRRTLDLDLPPTGNLPAARFAGLDAGDLHVTLAPRRRQRDRAVLAMLATILAGAMLLRRCARLWWRLAAVVVVAGTLLAVWMPSMVGVADGATLGVLAVAVAWSTIRAVGWFFGRLTRLPTAPAPPVWLIAAVWLAWAAADAGAEPARRAAPAPDEPNLPVIGLYEGSGAGAPEPDRVFVPFHRYAELWARANPDARAGEPAPGTDVSAAGTSYTLTLADDRVELTLSSSLNARGAGWRSVPIGLGGVAIRSATLDGRETSLQRGPEGTVLRLRAPRTAGLTVQAHGTAQRAGRKGHIELTLPPLPGAVMRVVMPDPQLQLEAVGPAEAPVRDASDRRAGVWVLAVGDARKVRLSWAPETSQAVDRTVKAEASHDVEALHWALRGRTELTYAYAGQRDRFELLLPASASVTAIEVPNLRDHRVVGAETVDGVRYDRIGVRLHRPADRRASLSVGWVAPLPSSGQAVALHVPRARGVGRERGRLTLHQARGLEARIAASRGARRAEAPQTTMQPGLDEPVPVARYAWSDRPMSLTLRVVRPRARLTAKIDQLVRLSEQDVQLLADLAVESVDGAAPGFSALLPQGFDVLAVTGGEVETWHVQEVEGDRTLRVEFVRSVPRCRVAIVLVRRSFAPGRFPVPMLTVLDPDDAPLEEPRGRLAVQMAPSLEARTLSQESLDSIDPGETGDWLGRAQASTVRFAYRYRSWEGRLVLGVRPRPTRTRVELTAGVSVRPSRAVYTYRFRYHVEGSPIDRVNLSIPAEIAPRVAVDSPSLRSVRRGEEADGNVPWTILLTDEITGVLDVTLNFSLPVDDSTRRLSVPPIDPGEVDRQEVTLAVQNLSRHEVEFEGSGSLRKAEFDRLGELSAGGTLESLRHVLHGLGRDWSASLAVSPAKVALRTQAVIDLMAIRTLADADGRLRYQVVLDLVNRREQFLRISVPDELRLWSARVAGQAVKPVLPPGEASGEVLVPLVKTTVAAIPYEVELYLAGQAERRIDGIGRFAPPRVSVLNVPVKRTTWTLFLPRAFRYIQPAGNMSPLAGGKAEADIIRMEAGLDQLRRMVRSLDSDKGWTYEGGEKGELLKQNWKLRSKEVSEQYGYNVRQLEQDRSHLNTEAFQRLSRRVKDLESEQRRLARQVESRPDDAGRRADVNRLLNATSDNAGLSEFSRNRSLNELPGFVQEAQEAQKRNYRQLTGGNKGGGDGKQDQAQQQRAERLKRQLQSYDKQVQGYYRGTRQAAPDTDEQGQPRQAQPPSPRDDRMSGPFSRWGDETRDDGLDAQGLAGQLPSSGLASGETGQSAGRDSPAPSGAYSLPLELPPHGVRLDFACPGGQPTVSVLAVPADAWRSGRVTAWIVGALLALMVVVLVGRRILARWAAGSGGARKVRTAS